MRFAFRAVVSTLLCLMAAATGGCDGELTQLVVVVDTDLSVPGEADAFRLRIVGPDVEEQTQRFSLSDGDAVALPASLGLVPGGERLDPVRLEATALLGPVEVVSTTIETGFLKDETRLVRLFLAASCQGVSCAAAESCDHRGCRPVRVEPTELPPVGATDAGSPIDDCTPSAETCNGADDDCDSIVDEDLDEDGDGFVPCGNMPDCDDSDPAVFLGDPARSIVPPVELCDGVDNDCDGGVDGVAAACASSIAVCFEGSCVPPDCFNGGVVCEPGTHCERIDGEPSCHPGDCTRPEDACEDPLECDAQSRLCVAPGALGTPCDLDAQCSSELCFDMGNLGLSAGRRCSQACCADSDCPLLHVCWPAASGAKLCVRDTVVRADLRRGSGGGSEPCTENAECESGICRGTDGCLANCGRDSDCPPGQSCSLQQFDRLDDTDFIQAACTSEGGMTPDGQTCDVDTDCASGVCVFGSFCAAMCAGADECEGNQSCVPFGGAGADQVLFCSINLLGTMAAGATCGGNLPCRDKLCVDGSCRAPCCNDAQCEPGQLCRPSLNDGRWRMGCL